MFVVVPFSFVMEISHSLIIGSRLEIIETWERIFEITTTTSFAANTVELYFARITFASFLTGLEGASLPKGATHQHPPCPSEASLIPAAV